MKKYLLLIFILISFQLYSQVGDTLKLAYCQQLARQNYPLLRQKELLSNSSLLRLKNIKTAYLPQLNLNGQASYQSDVTIVPINMPGIEIPAVSKDMYKLNFDLTEMIYDGGLTKAQQRLEQINNETEQENIEVELYKLKEKINQLYFNVLLLQQNKSILLVAMNELENRLIKVESGISNGILTSNNADVIRVEILKLQGQMVEADYARLSSLEMLGVYLNSDIPSHTVLEVPETSTIINVLENNRKEMGLFDLQKNKLNISKLLVNSRTKPKVYGFVQLGYGRPGLNMLADQFDTYYMLGIRLSWNLWNWNQGKNDKMIIDIQSEMIDNQKSIFEQGLSLIRKKYIYEIQKLEKLIEKDSEILRLRRNILAVATSQLENGTITETDYMTEKNAGLQAKINLENHKLQLVKAKIDYLTAFGKY